MDLELINLRYYKSNFSSCYKYVQNTGFSYEQFLAIIREKNLKNEGLYDQEQQQLKEEVKTVSLEKNEGINYINQLPNEVLAIVFKHMGLNNLFTVSQIC